MTRHSTFTGIVMSVVLAVSPALLGLSVPTTPSIPAVGHEVQKKPDVKPPKPPKAPKPSKPPKAPHGPTAGPPPSRPAAGGDPVHPPIAAGASTSRQLAGRSAASVLGVRLGPLTVPVETASRSAPAPPSRTGTRHRDGPDSDLVLAGPGSAVLLEGSDDLLGPTVLAFGLGVAMITLAAALVWGHRRR